MEKIRRTVIETVINFSTVAVENGVLVTSAINTVRVLGHKVRSAESEIKKANVIIPKGGKIVILGTEKLERTYELDLDTFLAYATRIGDPSKEIESAEPKED